MAEKMLLNGVQIGDKAFGYFVSFGLSDFKIMRGRQSERHAMRVKSII